MDVDVDIERSATVEVPFARVKERMLDLEGTLGLFPKLARLTPVGERRFEWQLEPIGFKPAGISHVVRYTTDFSVDTDRGVVEWTPVRGEGNSLIRGRWVTADRGDHIDITLSISGTIGGIRVPLAFRLAVPALCALGIHCSRRGFPRAARREGRALSYRAGGGGPWCRRVRRGCGGLRVRKARVAPR